MIDGFRFSRQYLSTGSAHRGIGSNKKTVSPFKIILFLLLHLPLGFVFRYSSIITTIYAWIVLAMGLFFLTRDRQPTRLICLVAYITGAEVLWRAAGVSVFWETGKYALILFFVLALLKYSLGKKITIWPVFYFALLLPSVFLMPKFDRQQIAINLAGPLALAISVMFFGVIRVRLYDFKLVMAALLAPTITLSVYVLSGIATAQEIIIGSGSNMVLSGDYGPNQVSAALALGALFAIYCVQLERNWIYRIIYIVLALWLLGQSALTFSRTGVWLSLLAVFVTGVYLMSNYRKMAGFVFSSLVLGLLAYFVIFPFLDNFTGNALSTRFSDMNSSGRVEIIQADLMVFKQYPIFGVGPNQSKPYHELTFRYSSAHTEYSRMLAEHGVLGLLSLLLMAQAVFRCFTRKQKAQSKAYSLGILVWSLLFMLVSATRLVAPSFLFGLACAYFTLEDGVLVRNSYPSIRTHSNIPLEVIVPHD